MVTGWRLGVRSKGSEFRVQGSGFRVSGSGFRVQGSGSDSKVQGFGLRVCRQGEAAGAAAGRTKSTPAPFSVDFASI